MNTLGIDFGTTSYSACFFSNETRNFLFTNRKNDSLIIDGLNSEFKITKVRSEFKSFINDLGKVFNLNEVEAITITGNMHSFFLVKNDTPITNIITWQDQRSLEKYKDNESYIEYINKNYRELFSKFQHYLTPGYAVTTLLPLSQIIDFKGCSLHFAPEFLLKELLGDKPYSEIPTDHSFAHSSGFYDLESKDWNYRLIEELGYNDLLLPRIEDAGSFVGYVGNHIPQLSGVPIYLGLGDNQASVLGSIFEKKINDEFANIFDESKILVMNIGTSGQISSLTRKTNNVSEFLEYRPFVDDYLLLIGASLSAGKTIEVIKNFTKEILEKITKKNYDDNKIYEIIKNSVLPYSTLKFRTTLNGTRYDPYLRGFIDNISLTNFTYENLITAAAYGIIEELYFYYQKMDFDCETIIGIGTGLQKNPFFQNIIKKVFKTDFFLSKLKETTSFGAAICALNAKLYGKEVLDHNFK